MLYIKLKLLEFSKFGKATSKEHQSQITQPEEGFWVTGASNLKIEAYKPCMYFQITVIENHIWALLREARIKP